ncbi:MAG: hypothetical protein JWM80_377 [Cyanobacteria bacterium RYN_339]|nr:hypothetical protein [Cyanobacteria bacterium RYN_339]
MALTFRKLTGVQLGLAISASLTACVGGPLRGTANQESVVHGAVAGPSTGQSLALRRPDGSPLEGAIVDVGGSLVEVRNGRVAVPADVWQRALAAGSLLITVPGYLPIKVAATADPGAPVATDALGVVSLVALPLGAASVPIGAPGGAVAGSTSPGSGAPAPVGLAAGQPVLTLPNGQVILPDNGPGLLDDFNTGAAAGTGSVLARASTSTLARSVVDLRTGVSVFAHSGESPAAVVTRANGGPIVANNGVSIVADNGASVTGGNGGTTIVANHGGGVISDNGAGVKPVDDGNHDLQGSYVVAYPYAPFSPPQAKLQLLALGVPNAPLVRTSQAGLREWLWPGTLQARAIAITGEPLSDWTLTDSNGRFAIALPPAMPLLFFLETQPVAGLALESFHEYALTFAPRGRVSLVGVDSSTSYNAIPFIYLTTYVNEQTASGAGALTKLEAQLASLQAQLAAANAVPDPAGAASVQAQIDPVNARIAQIKALLAYLKQLESELDAGKNQIDINAVFRFLKNPPATSILAAPALKTAYDGLKGESLIQGFDPVSYPLVNLP